MCCFKFRLWNCLSYSQNSETAGLHKAIINIKRSRRQAVTALNIIVIANYPFEKHYILASLVKGRWIDGKAQVLILLLSACDMPIIFMLQTFCRQDGGIASPPSLACTNPPKTALSLACTTTLASPRKREGGTADTNFSLAVQYSDSPAFTILKLFRAVTVGIVSP